MKKIRLPLFGAGLLLLLGANLPAQDGEIFSIKTRLLENFEKNNPWIAEVSGGKDAQARLAVRPGQPADLERTEPEVRSAGAERSALGLRVDVTEPGEYVIILRPARPLPIGRGVKTLSAWVYGHNLEHTLSLRIRDPGGFLLCEITAGRLNYLGWKKITVAFPPLSLDKTGALFDGFKIALDTMGLRPGSLYFYFDFITVTEDRFGE